MTIESFGREDYVSTIGPNEKLVSKHIGDWEKMTLPLIC